MPLSDDTLRAFEARLTDKREAIVALEEARRDSSAVVELDQTRTGRLSRMDAMQLQAMARAGDARARTELHRIDAALRRIATGEFGYCLDCSDEIAGARLEADPAATLCLACAEAREQSR